MELELLSVSPQLLTFYAPYDRSQRRLLTLLNPTNKQVLFKIKSNVVRLYKVIPCAGRIEPYGTCEISITLHKLDYQEDLNHLFSIHSIFAPRDHLNGQTILSVFRGVSRSDISVNSLSVCLEQKPLSLANSGLDSLSSLIKTAMENDQQLRPLCPNCPNMLKAPQEQKNIKKSGLLSKLIIIGSLMGVAVLVSAARIAGPEERIIGGHYIPIENVAYQVSLQDKRGHFCGGTILSERVILTAAHCLYGQIIQDISVRAGSSHWKRDGQVVKVLKAILHPQYDQRTVAHDAAVMILESPLIFDANVQKIALAEETPKEDTMSLVTGWGFTRENSGYVWPVLQGVHVATIDHNDCQNVYNNLKNITKDMICADEPGSGSCTTDSGGPLVSVNDQKLIGIVSFGEGCAREKPGVYADVAFLREWINKTIVNNINCIGVNT
ncbi:trypsin epsilon-like isoform X2 [Drosophila takahashii]|uniref:trypsin epsilon-like isoform X2 n=1 Tax=Drosophila takahashii TaxID=29030 RepID=UPI003898E471